AAIGEAFREQVTVVTAPLCEIAGEGDHVRPSVDGVPEHVLPPGDAGDQVVIGDRTRDREGRCGKVRGSGRCGHWWDSWREGVRTDRYVIVMFAPIEPEGKAR